MEVIMRENGNKIRKMGKEF
jgi:hypothetical protein